ncbi:MAG: PhzF family phenazine biosynthesis protein [Geminocystis sp.]|nr:PhzF family phenazine biosynthesis protein [Geminocystis sp.]HIK38674.1 PhzF family phenazine biosynthesis protein [Geminocystis sp. M7585_C2015_104]MCS7147645.1 PhzF family phenazine biosynthesis protein [Geminocystis sp.]MCX8078041.1 PhzF family phenazine biosynthesis protein [Geminocystis sp.]MDW8117283.1 PhzF family phenazine biosynthesis protein [Geminocystis sp.]
MRFNFYTLDVFANKVFCGNQLAVFPDASGLKTEIMAKIAREFNFSETAFVFPPSHKNANYLVRIFTPAGEIPFAGHPTIGTAFLLAYLDKSNSTQLILEEQIGLVPVKIYRQGEQVIATELTTPSIPDFLYYVPPRETLAAILSLSQEDLHPSFTAQAVSSGLPFLIVPLASTSALSRARINYPFWQEILAKSPAPHLYPCVPLSDRQWQVRMFAPLLSIKEDPATGSAAAALGAYLARLQPETDGRWEWQITQGVEMERPSKITVIATKQAGQTKDIRVKGECVIVSQGIFHLD